MKIGSDIICVHYYYPPIRSGGVLRNYYMSRAFAQMFDHVHIITTSNVDVMAQEDLPLPDNVIIYKASTKDFRSVVTSGNHISMSRKNSAVFKALSKLKKTLPFHFYLDEGGQRYIKSAIKIGKEIIEKYDVSHMYSSFMPYADHKIASKLKSAFPNKLNWYADFRDLQVEPEYKNVYFEGWNKRQERKILNSAEKVSTISEGLAKHLRGLHPKVISLPRGIIMREERKSVSSVFTMVYTGSLFYDYRDGKSVVSEVKRFIEKRNISPDTFQFVYAGREGEIWEKWFQEVGMKDYLDNKGFVARKEALSLQNDAGVLLLLTSSSDEHQGVFTGKLFEYLETGNPIMNYINGVKDIEFEELFRSTDAGDIFYPDTLGKIGERLDYYYGLWEKGKLRKMTEAGLAARKGMGWLSRAGELMS